MIRAPQHVVVRGAPLERGEQYGRLARDKIHRCVASYREAFRHRAGLDWERALGRARSFEPAIAAFSPDGLQEMRGIAAGAGVPFDAILALNCRSELMFAAAPGNGALPGECTSFAVTPQASAERHMLLGQNWDWVAFARELCVLVEVRREDKPAYATVVEAGMLAKVGVNAAGLGICTNTLVSEQDAGRSGVPYHLMLRALLDAGSVAEASRILHSAHRALSANYLLADRTGDAANFETTAGGADTVRVTRPERGLLAHANHFLDADFAPIDRYVKASPHSLVRLESMRGGLAQDRVSVERLQALLRDHRYAPNGICSHPDPAAHPMFARATIASIIMDLTTGDTWLTEGPPCESEYQRYALIRSSAATARQS
jgi:isopenicillin-N N-acyltransferase-like protein